MAGAGWAAGRHQGTTGHGGALTLPAGAERGAWGLEVAPDAPFDRLLLSLGGGPWPAGARVRATAQVEVDGAWTDCLSLGVYGSGPDLPRSEATPPSRGARVAVDVLQTGEVEARRAQLSLELIRGPGGPPRVRRAVVATWRSRGGAPPPADGDAPGPACGVDLAVPERSQAVEDPAIAGRICSPTSLAMVLAFYGVARPTADVAAGVYDHGADIYGNWSFNVAYAAALGFRATATRLDGIRDLEAEVAAGRPVVISHRWAAGELQNAAFEPSDGHLIVVRGFTAAGDVIANDPAASPAQDEAVRRVYRREDLRRTWLGRGDGVAYVVRSPG